MPVTTQLFAYGLRQVLSISEEPAGQLAETAGLVIESSGTVGKIIFLVRRHFTDHSQALPRALNHANERAWQSLAVSLAGDDLLDRLKVFFSSPVPQAVQAQVKAFLAHNAARHDTTSEHMRRACLSELHQASTKGLLAVMPEADEIARQAVLYKGMADPASLLADAQRAASEVANAFPAEYANLARLLRQGAAAGQPPLLVVAFAHFFRREIQTNAELVRGLTFDLLQRLAENQELALREVGQALVSLGRSFDLLLGEVLEQLGRMESKLDDIREKQADIRQVGHSTNERVVAIQAMIEKLHEDIRLAARNPAEARHQAAERQKRELEEAERQRQQREEAARRQREAEERQARKKDSGAKQSSRERTLRRRSRLPG